MYTKKFKYSSNDFQVSEILPEMLLYPVSCLPVYIYTVLTPAHPDITGGF